MKRKTWKERRANLPDDWKWTSELSRTQEEVRQREIEALRLRARGHSVAEIARLLGYRSTGAAQNVIYAALKKQQQEHNEAAEALRELEMIRLDEMLVRSTELIESVLEDTKLSDADKLAAITNAHNGILKAMERRARYTGLDQPVRLDASHSLSLAQELQLLDQMDTYNTDDDAVVIDAEIVASKGADDEDAEEDQR